MRRVLLAVVTAMIVTAWPAQAQLFPTSFPSPEPDGPPAVSEDPRPAPPVTADPTRRPSAYGAFVDAWGRTNPDPPTTFGIIIDEFGVGTVIWRTGNEPKGAIATGKALAYFTKPVGQSITGQVLDTNDDRVIANGPVSLTRVTPYVSHLTQGTTVWTLCSAAIAGQALAAGQPEPPCVDP
jgi:hypothetical protein